MTHLPIREPREKRGLTSFTGLGMVHYLAFILILIAQPALHAEDIGCTEEELRLAIEKGGLVTFGSNCSITVTSPIWILVPNTVIDAGGNAVTISGGGVTNIFVIEAMNVVLEGITFSSGKSQFGGALTIKENASVTASNCRFISNTATGTNAVAGVAGQDQERAGSDGGNGSPGGDAQGGAIYSRGELALFNCSMLTNSAVAGDGGAGGVGGNGTGTLSQGGDGGNGGKGGRGDGGAVFNAGTLTISNCTFTGNSATGGNGGSGGAAGTGVFGGSVGHGGAGGVSFGGAVFTTADAVMNVIVQSAFSANTTRGGNSADGGTDADSQRDGLDGPNGADSGGGAYCNRGESKFENCTFYSNTARGGNGGKGGPGTGTLSRGGDGGNGGNAYGGSVLSSAALDLWSCTLVGGGVYAGTNGAGGSGVIAGSAGNMGQAGGGNFSGGSGGTVMTGTLIGAASAGSAGAGTVSDGGYNMVYDNSIALGSGSWVNVKEMKLGTFGAHGGDTPTIPLQGGSPALDRIPDANAPSIDQRGFNRPQDGGSPQRDPLSDIGAYEARPPSLSTNVIGGTNLFVGLTNVITTVNGTATFRASAEGDDLRYRWRFGGSLIPNATSSSYTVTTATTANRGPYQVTVTNDFGWSTSSVAYINFRPAITTQPANRAVPVGSTVTFNPTVTGDEPIRYQWYHNGTNLLAGQTSASLTFTNAQLDKAGTYEVGITNEFGGARSFPATLNFLPTIITQPASTSVPLGGSVTFSVVATGSPSLGYQWRMNGASLAGATSSSFSYNSVQVTNYGNYDVVIANGYGAVTSQVAILRLGIPVGGLVQDGTNPVAGALITITMGTGTNAAVLTREDGTFLAYAGEGTYSVKPSGTNRLFSPTSLQVTVPPMNTSLVFASAPLLVATKFTDGTVRVHSAGLTNVNYVLEGSANLTNWQPLTNSVQGQIDYIHQPALDAHFFRISRPDL